MVADTRTTQYDDESSGRAFSVVSSNSFDRGMNYWNGSQRVLDEHPTCVSLTQEGVSKSPQDYPNAERSKLRFLETVSFVPGIFFGAGSVICKGFLAQVTPLN